MPRNVRKNVGLIGLGIIGARAATALRAGGFQVFVWNRTPQAAPNFLRSPAEVARVCDTIQIFVADQRALFHVIEAMADVLTPEHLIICSATVGPEATLEAEKRLAEKGARLLDAPFTGSKLAAENRQLVYYVGGDEELIARARPILEATSKAIIPIGRTGDAAIVKVVTNMIAAVSIQTLAESLAIVKKAGIDPDIFAEALAQNACRSGTMDLKLPKMMAGDYEPHFSLKHMFKDVQLGVHVANALGLEVPATTVTAGVMYGAVNRGWGDQDFAALFRLYEHLVEKKPAPAPEPQPEPAAVTAEPEPLGVEPPAEPVGAEAVHPAEAVPPLEVVGSVPASAKAAGEAAAAPVAEAPRQAAEVFAKPFNRIRRFFGPSRGEA